MQFLASDINQKVFQYTSILKRAKAPYDVRKYINSYGDKITCPQNDNTFKTIMYSLMIHPLEYQKYGHYDDWYQLYNLPEREKYDFRLYERDDLETVVSTHLRNQNKFIGDLKEADIVVTQEMIQRYEKFIRLFKKKHDTVIVPTFDIDVLWHAHMLTPEMYASDMKNVLGRVLDHDDGFDKNNLVAGFASTENIWEREYKEPYRIAKKKNEPGCGDGSDASTAVNHVHRSYFFANSNSTPNLHSDSPSIDVAVDAGGGHSCGSSCGGGCGSCGGCGCGG